MKNTTIIIISLMMIIGNIHSETIFQRGCAIYRELPSISSSQNVWHGALFSHFEIYNHEEIRVARFVYHEIVDNYWSDATKKKAYGNYYYHSDYGYIYGPSFEDNSQLANIKKRFKDKFCDENEFKGGFYNPNLKGNLESLTNILSKANEFCSKNNIWYTMADMIDKKNIWVGGIGGKWKSWNAKFGMMDDVRCDAMVEYCYEKNDIYVARGGYFIGHKGDKNLNKHNNLASTVSTYDKGETCPRQQAGKLGNDSDLLPIPNSDGAVLKSITTYKPTQYYEENEPCFSLTIGDKFSDMAYLSIKSYSKYEKNNNIDSDANYIKFKSSSSDYYSVKYISFDLFANDAYDEFNFRKHFRSSFIDGNLMSEYGNRFNYDISLINQGGTLTTFKVVLPPEEIFVCDDIFIKSDKDQYFYATKIILGKGLEIINNNNIQFEAEENIVIRNNCLIRPQDSETSVKLRILIN